jgi:hypothetical protein
MASERYIEEFDLTARLVSSIRRTKDITADVGIVTFRFGRPGLCNILSRSDLIVLDRERYHRDRSSEWGPDKFRHVLNFRRPLVRRGDLGWLAMYFVRLGCYFDGEI